MVVLRTHDDLPTELAATGTNRSPSVPLKPFGRLAQRMFQAGCLSTKGEGIDMSEGFTHPPQLGRHVRRLDSP